MTTNTSSISDRDKLLFEVANKNHTHQDTLRWTLAAAYAAFFAATMTASFQPTVIGQPILAIILEYAACMIGSVYLILLQVEGWYYNLYLAYLVECEKRLHTRHDLFPMVRFPRNKVPVVHPSYVFVLFMVSVLNTYHLLEAVHLQTKRWDWAIMASVAYVIVAMLIVLRGSVPEWIDRTWGGPDDSDPERWEFS